jgi:hypothetical protein
MIEAGAVTTRFGEVVALANVVVAESALHATDRHQIVPKRQGITSYYIIIRLIKTMNQGISTSIKARETWTEGVSNSHVDEFKGVSADDKEVGVEIILLHRGRQTNRQFKI